jgi:hypothetical protein
VRRAKLANLTVAGVDLRDCRFDGAHGLDRLRLEADCEFATTPGGWRSTRRAAIAEELEWRARHRKWDDWYPMCWLPKAAQLDAAEIAAIYRQLRKAKEDSKDEPGAADFYYGEMEMRRQSPRQPDPPAHAGAGGNAELAGDIRFEGEPHAPFHPTPTAERLVLWVYWLVSGYGLRASRALVALGLTIVLFALLLDWWGFRPARPFGSTLLFSIESTSSLFRVPETRGFMLTAGGEVLQVILRLLGPLFFGLALLSLRGRVKR